MSATFATIPTTTRPAVMGARNSRSLEAVLESLLQSLFLGLFALMRARQWLAHARCASTVRRHPCSDRDFAEHASWRQITRPSMPQAKEDKSTREKELEL